MPSEEDFKCSFERFQEHYYPFMVPDKHWHDILSKVLERHDLFTENDEGKKVFKAFMEAIPGGDDDPDYVHEGEARIDNLYRPLHDIATAIAEAALQVAGFGETREFNYVFRPCPQTMIHSVTTGSYSNIVDAVFEKRCPCGEGQLHGVSEHLEPLSSPQLNVDGHPVTSMSTYDVACVFMLRTKNTSDGLTQEIASATAQVINDDARRMFGYGFTIEGYEVTVSYFCRSRSVASEILSLNNPGDLNRLIGTFISFMFATDEEMGYDPTVSRHDRDGLKAQYTFRIPDSDNGRNSDRFFRTVDTIYDYGSLDVTDKSTRVWLVEEKSSAEDDASPVGNPAICYVLKDVWHPAKARTEKQIQDSIFEGIKEFLAASPLPPEKADLAELQSKNAHLLLGDSFKRYFTTIVAEYQGRMTPAYDEDMEQTFTTTGYPVSQVEKKRQYRVVFKEVCTDVGRMQNLGDVMDVLQEVLIPLQLMHCAGWVHRDISSGNVLAYRSDENQRWQAKLSDLEYVKEFPPTKGHAGTKHVKIGTPNFMPHEILNKAYFTPSTKEGEKRVQELLVPIQEETDELDAQLDEYKKRLHGAARANRDKNSSHDDFSSTVVHNPQHDVESLWWLGLWTLTMRVDHGPSREWANPIFRDTLYLSAARHVAFTKDIMFKLYDNLRPNLRRPFAQVVELFRRRLYSSYWVRELADDVLNLNSYRDTYTYADNFFKNLRNGPSAWREQDLKNPQYLETLYSLKRARSMMSNPATASASGEAHVSSAQATSSKRRKV